MPTAWLHSQMRRPCVRSLGHEVTETAFTEITPDAGAAIGQVFNAATAWIMHYWIKRLGREPGVDEIEPLTRAYWEMGRRVSAAEYLVRSRSSSASPAALLCSSPTSTCG